MYQVRRGFKGSETDFKKLSDHFEQTVIKIDSEDNRVYDLGATYTINRVCIWNSVFSLGKDCVIIQKNSKIALVKFKGQHQKQLNILNCIFRLEDLIIKVEQNERKTK